MKRVCVFFVQSSHTQACMHSFCDVALLCCC
uniref:Uncharacterized protein n=1 Tax=Anguilla anguilla TaxID=7936 RepID=A0A0E9Q9Q5_ANGAN